MVRGWGQVWEASAGERSCQKQVQRNARGPCQSVSLSFGGIESVKRIGVGERHPGGHKATSRDLGAPTGVLVREVWVWVLGQPGDGASAG